MKIVIISANKTPIVTLKRRLSSNIQILGSISIKVIFDVSGEDPYRVYEVIPGNIVTAGIEPAPFAKPISLYVGLLMLEYFPLIQVEHGCRIRFDNEMKRGNSVLSYYLLHWK